MLDSFSTNCSATDDVDAVELDTAPESRFLPALEDAVAEAVIVALSSRNRVTEHEELADAETDAEAFCVMPSTP